MKSNTAIIAAVFVLLATLNGTIWLSAYTHYLSWDYAFYFFWGETVLVGLLTLFLYAKHLLVFFLLLLAVSSFFGMRHFTFMGDMKIPLSFWGIYSLFWLIYFEIRMSPISHGMRRHHPLYQLTFYLAYMTVAILLSAAVTSYIYFGQFYMPHMQAVLMHQFMAMAIGIPTLTIGILRIVNMVGDRHVIAFMLGTYHHPVEKRRVVMFLDMVGSSSAAEKMGPAQSMEMIARFIFDASSSFRVNGGDIVNYTGDGLVVLWSIYEGDKVIRAIDTLARRLARNKDEYEKNFGFVPDYRIGIHAGPVVLSQIGEEKLFLGVYGDVVNTAARIEQMNKDMNSRILMSKAFKQYVGLQYQGRIKAMGKTEVRGKEEEIEVFTLAQV